MLRILPHSPRCHQYRCAPPCSALCLGLSFALELAGGICFKPVDYHLILGALTELYRLRIYFSVVSFMVEA